MNFDLDLLLTISTKFFDKYKLRFLWGVLRWVDFYNVRTYVQIDVAITFSTFIWYGRSAAGV
eukprot:SAG11_NODE_12392_length_705_cov_13.907591_1_plen_62_part_00